MRAARRDIAVYMKRQFGAGGPRTPAKNKSKGAPSQIVEVSGYSPTSGSRQPLGEILQSSGVISASDLEIALAAQRARGGRIGEILVQDGAITEDQLTAALAHQAHLPIIDADTLLTRQIADSLLRRFPRDAAQSMCLMPLEPSADRRTVVLAIADPYDERAVLESKVILGVSEVEIQLAARTAIRDAIARWYPEDQVEDLLEEAIVIEDEELVEVGPPVVLIADGNKAAAEELAERVREEEFEVVVTDDGKEAREVCRSRDPIVVFLDASLPRIDGYNILLDIRSRDADAAVFITSGRSDDFHQAKALELGADDFIAKPYSIEVTTSKVRREIQKRAGGRKRIAAPAGAANGVSGSLEDMTLLDIIQSLELGRKTASVMIRYDDGRVGELGVLNGDIKAVDGAGREGEQAFFSLAKGGPGMFRIEYRAPGDRVNIQRPNTFLILEALRLIDEENASMPPRPPDEVSIPPTPAEGLTPIFPVDDLLGDHAPAPLDEIHLDLAIIDEDETEEAQIAAPLTPEKTPPVPPPAVLRNTPAPRAAPAPTAPVPNPPPQAVTAPFGTPPAPATTAPFPNLPAHAETAPFPSPAAPAPFGTPPAPAATAPFANTPAPQGAPPPTAPAPMLPSNPPPTADLGMSAPAGMQAPQPNLQQLVSAKTVVGSGGQPAPQPQGAIAPPPPRGPSGMQPLPGARPAAPGGPAAGLPASLPPPPQPNLQQGQPPNLQFPNHSQAPQPNLQHTPQPNLQQPNQPSGPNTGGGTFVWKPAVDGNSIPSAATTAVGPPAHQQQFQPAPSNRASMIEEQPIGRPIAYEPAPNESTGVFIDGPPSAGTHRNPPPAVPPPAMPQYPPSAAPPAHRPPPRTVELGRAPPSMGRPNPNMPRQLGNIPQPASRRLEVAQPPNPRGSSANALGRVPLQRVASVVQRPASQFHGAAVERVKGPHISAPPDRRPPRPRTGPGQPGAPQYPPPPPPGVPGDDENR